MNYGFVWIFLFVQYLEGCIVSYSLSEKLVRLLSNLLQELKAFLGKYVDLLPYAGRRALMFLMEHENLLQFTYSHAIKIVVLNWLFGTHMSSSWKSQVICRKILRLLECFGGNHSIISTFMSWSSSFLENVCYSINSMWFFKMAVMQGRLWQSRRRSSGWRTMRVGGGSGHEYRAARIRQVRDSVV